MFMELWLNLLQEQRLSSSLINPAAAGSGNHSSSSSRKLQAERFLASSSQDTTGSAAAFRIEATEPTDPACFSLDLHRLEGVFFMLLCSVDEAIRLDAYSALGVLRTLHQQLYTMAEELGVDRGGASLQMQQSQQQPAGSSGMAAAGAVGGSFSSVSTLATQAAAAEGGAAAAVTPLASSVASGSGMFFRHKATASRDSAEFMQTLGRFWLYPTTVAPAMSVHQQQSRAHDQQNSKCSSTCGL
jgi:hypothetical protein